MSELVVITGGAGFIGSHLAQGFLRNGYRVRVIDNLSAGSLANLAAFRNDIEFQQTDIRDLDGVTKAMQGASVVLHHAALVSVVESVADPARTHSINVTGTHNVLLAASRAGARRVVLASSSAVYGDNGIERQVETVSPCPVSPYGFSKWIDEVYASQFARTTGLETVSLRYFNVFGPRQRSDTQYAAVIPIFIDKLIRDASPTIFGDGTQTRDFTFVGNIVRANLHAAKASTTPGEALNIATGQMFSVNQLLGHLNQILGTNICAIYEPPRGGDIKHSCADTSKAEKLLGNYNVTSFQQGLIETVEWAKTQVARG